MADDFRIKTCGMARYEDAQLAVDLGAWALGFIFHRPSPRAVEPDVAREIVRRLPSDTLTIGVFVDRPLEEIEATEPREPEGDLLGCFVPVPARQFVDIPVELYQAVRELYPESKPPFRARPFDVQIIGADSIQRRNHPHQHMINAFEITHVFHHINIVRLFQRRLSCADGGDFSVRWNRPRAMRVTLTSL